MMEAISLLLISTIHMTDMWFLGRLYISLRVSTNTIMPSKTRTILIHQDTV